MGARAARAAAHCPNRRAIGCNMLPRLRPAGASDHASKREPEAHKQQAPGGKRVAWFRPEEGPPLRDGNPARRERKALREITGQQRRREVLKEIVITTRFLQLVPSGGK